VYRLIAPELFAIAQRKCAQFPIRLRIHNIAHYL
jgi:hypothetical protein